jgi:hypothetical protein
MWRFRAAEGGRHRHIQVGAGNAESQVAVFSVTAIQPYIPRNYMTTNLVTRNIFLGV